jgi:hypothetical protein
VVIVPCPTLPFIIIAQHISTTTAAGTHMRAALATLIIALDNNIIPAILEY